MPVMTRSLSSSSSSSLSSLNSVSTSSSLSTNLSSYSYENLTTWKSPYASLKTPCDVCNSRAAMREIRERTLAENPWLRPAVVDTTTSSSEEEQAVLDEFVDAAAVRGPCVKGCTGWNQCALNRNRDIEDAKRWLANQPLRQPR
ncbi:hypothetical protein T439DRAFT_358087 [Meredithblackwellia eburnea MCA 4105]